MQYFQFITPHVICFTPINRLIIMFIGNSELTHPNLPSTLLLSNYYAVVKVVPSEREDYYLCICIESKKVWIYGNIIIINDLIVGTKTLPEIQSGPQV